MKDSTKILITSTILLVIGLLVFIRAPPMVSPTGAATTAANLSVNTTCIINVNTTNVNLSAGGIEPNTTTTVRGGFAYNNTGNSLQDIAINATAWAAGPAGIATIVCNRTRVTNTSGAAWDSSSSGVCGGSGAPNQSLLWIRTGQAAGTTNTAFLRVNIQANQTAGRYNQNVTLWAQC